jgi:fimbrial chaperone protein
LFHRRAVLAAAFAAATLSGPWASAASLRVSPVTLEARGGARATSITLVNDEKRPLNVQVRVFKWTQADGADRLEPTTDVVASPPAVTLAPGAEYVVRVVRTSRAPMTGEESYRLFVDELPDPAAARAGQIAIVMRHSLPVFFSDPTAEPRVSWRVERTPQGQVLVARNSGGRRLRIADLELKDTAGAVVHRRAGLSGYVLAGSEMRWPLKGAAAPRTLSARSDAGRVDVALAPPKEG